jgi:hypothetical protein
MKLMLGSYHFFSRQQLSDKNLIRRLTLTKEVNSEFGEGENLNSEFILSR